MTKVSVAVNLSSLSGPRGPRLLPQPPPTFLSSSGSLGTFVGEGPRTGPVEAGEGAAVCKRLVEPAYRERVGPSAKTKEWKLCHI